MAANKRIRIGPVALTGTYTTNIVNPAAAGAGTGYTPTASYMLLKHIRIVNTTAGALTFRLYIGATGANAAGTEFMGINKNVPANDHVDFYGELLLNAADFLVGGASSTGLTFYASGEVGLA